MLKQYASHMMCVNANSERRMAVMNAYRAHVAGQDQAAVLATIQTAGLGSSSLSEALGVDTDPTLRASIGMLLGVPAMDVPDCPASLLREFQESLVAGAAAADQKWFRLVALRPELRMDVWWFDDLGYYAHCAPGHPATEAEMRAYVIASQDTTEPPED